MGTKLAAYFDQAGQLGGLEAKVKLAMMTKLSRGVANDAPDSSENIKMFEEAMAGISKLYA
ncbi:MAG: hypothetical protein ACE5Q6_15170, partial [Dehalococcoidia bacterium]